MHRATFLILLILLYTRAEITVHAQNVQRLSLADAIQRVKLRSPLAQASDARVRGAEARAQGAGALQNPALTLAQPFGKNTGGLDEGIVLSQTIELGDRRRQRIYAAKAERDSVLAERTGVSFDLTFTVQSAYYEALRSDVELTLATNALENARLFASAAENQFKAGEVARSNVVRSRIELSRSEQALNAAETDRTNRYATLKSLTVLPEETPLVLTDTLQFTPANYRLPALVSLALQTRPDVRSAQRLREARIAAAHGASAQSQPDLFLEARRSTIDPTVGGNSLRVGISFPLFDWGRIKADTHSARALVQEQDATLRETLRTAKLEVENGFRNLEQAQRTVELFRAGRLDRAKELLEMTQLGYQKGANTYLELLDAQQVYRTEQAEYARVLTAYNIARATLQRAVGGTLP